MSKEGRQTITLMLCGDVMMGRGIDQILPYPSHPILHEAAARSAIDYVRIAERANGPIGKPTSFNYVWGDALEVFARRRPDARIVNLETAVTRSHQPWPKGINYRMNPDNVPCLTAAGIDCCVLANNHVIDWGREGLLETLTALRDAGVRTVGAGRDLDEAASPAILPIAGKGRVLVYAFACASSGVPEEWAAAGSRPGVNLLTEFSDATVESLGLRARKEKERGDIVVCSLHWGPNWGYGIPTADRAFAHRLVEQAKVDVVFGHSSHHPKAIEVHLGKPIFYGCGDILNDYEGIEGHESYRDDLTLVYLVEFDPEGQLAGLDMIPFRIRKFRLNGADEAETEWLRQTMDRECKQFGGRVTAGSRPELRLLWE